MGGDAKGRGRRGRPFLGYDSLRACARALGIPESAAFDAAHGYMPGARWVAALAAAGWTPPDTPAQRRPWAASTRARDLNSDCWRLADTGTIMSAREKPAHCSEARWRMELRRRARGGMTDAPDPRDL